MSLTLQRIIYGFEVTTGSNDSFPFKNHAGSSKTATIAPGVYTPKGLCTALNTAILATSPTDTITASFDHAAATFTVLDAAGTFEIDYGSGSALSNALFGYAASNLTGAASYTSAAVGTAPSTMSLWDLAEPLQKFSPVTGQAAGSAAKLLQREIRAYQNKSDGGSVETVYITQFKKIRLTFNQLSASEQTNMENFLDWAVQGKPFAFLPDKTAGSAVLNLVLEAPGSVQNAFSWLTRSESDYGELTFIEQASA